MVFITTATMAIRTIPTIAVAGFISTSPPAPQGTNQKLSSHASGHSAGSHILDFHMRALALPSRPKQEIQESCDKQNSYRRPNSKRARGDEGAYLEYAQRYEIRKHCLIADGEPGPLGVVHFPLDGAHRRKAGGAE